MKRRFRKSSRNPDEFFDGKHRFEHWYLDNQVYFITVTCRDHHPSFQSDAAKTIFWDRFFIYSKEFGFDPWVTSLMNNHWHSLGHQKEGEKLKLFMQRLHGSVAKLVNDILPERRANFWGDTKGEEYFDGCIRDEIQLRRAYRYALTQSTRHGLVSDWRMYPHTRAGLSLELALKRASELNAYLKGVPYKRYEH